MTWKPYEWRLSIQDDDGNWTEIKQCKSVNSNFRKIVISGIFIQSDVEYDKLYKRFNRCIFEDEALRKPYRNVIFSTTEWQNQGGE